jgi:DNA polymerase-3 subunit chi
VGEAYFYHLTRAPLEVTLRVLLEKSLAQPWRVAVRGRTDAVLERLDGQLWLGDGFLPHGRAGGAHDADQPVLLTTGSAGNTPDCLVSVEGADVTARRSRPIPA